MKIIAGLGSIDEYIPYVKAGADEFFCGYVPYSWTEKYGTLLPLNRREVLCSNVQLGAFSELEILAAMIRKYKNQCTSHLTPYIIFLNNTRKLLISLYGVCPLDFKALSLQIRRCFYICVSRESIARFT